MISTSKNEKLHMLMAFGGNAIFGFSFLFSKLAMDVADPLVLLSIRFLTAFILMTVLQLFGVVKCNLKGKDIRPLLILGLLQPVFYFIFESYGIKYTSSSVAGILIALIPIAGLVLGGIILKERPTLLQVIFSVVSVAGVIVMTVTGELGSVSQIGLLCLLGAVLSGSLFSVQSRRIADQFTAFERTYVMFGVGMAAFLVMALFGCGADWNKWLVPLGSGQFWVSIIYLSCVSSVGAFLLLNKALDVLDVTRSLVFSNVTTVISVLAGVLLLHEQFSPVQAIGIVMVLVGVFCVNRFTPAK